MKCEDGLKKDEIPNNIGRTGIDKLFIENSGYVKYALSTSDGTFNISEKVNLQLKNTNVESRKTN